LIARAADVAPYEARVATPRAQIRSGPGEKFYPTDTLVSGETVEVYREEEDGWLGIRPPEKSFSWVLERQLKFRNDGLAEIGGPDVPSRIGSRLSDQRNAVQVQLKKGETVEVLDNSDFDGKTWCKIAPPAGEFRWVHATNVQRVRPLVSSEADTTAEPEAAEPEVVTASASTETPAAKAKPAEVEAPPLVTEPLGTEPPVSTGEQWRAPGAAAATPPAAGTATPGINPLTPIGMPPASQPAVAIAPSPGPPTSVAAASKPPAPVVNTASGELQRQLTEIEMRLSRMAAASPHLWNTERLERDTEQLLAQAQTDADRYAIKMAMAKIDQFATLGRRYQAGAGVSGLGAGGAVAGLYEAGGSSAAVTDPSYSGRYDAVGILRPVVSKRPGAPQFALVDERGQVVTFVTPSPDVNMQPYLGRRIGITGNRGFIPEFNRAHVTAGRVTPLNQGMMR
jgi:hypothetical protein